MIYVIIKYIWLLSYQIKLIYSIILKYPAIFYQHHNINLNSLRIRVIINNRVLLY